MAAFTVRPLILSIGEKREVCLDLHFCALTYTYVHLTKYQPLYIIRITSQIPCKCWVSFWHRSSLSFCRFSGLKTALFSNLQIFGPSFPQFIINQYLHLIHILNGRLMENFKSKAATRRVMVALNTALSMRKLLLLPTNYCLPVNRNQSLCLRVLW